MKEQTTLWETRERGIFLSSVLLTGIMLSEIKLKFIVTTKMLNIR